MTEKLNLKDFSLPELRAYLGVSEDGLSQEEALKRLAQFGANELREKEVNPLLKFLSYFFGPIPWMIEAALVLSAIVCDWTDFFIIFILLIANAAVGFWEEFQAGNTILALKSKLALKAKVKRSGAWQVVPSRDLVPGDIIRIRIGDIVPADAKLIEGDTIEIDQSSLTGESLPVEKKTGDSVYSGSTIKRGEIDAIIYATGENTYFGLTTELVAESHTVSHFQRAILKIGNYLIVITAALVCLILAAALSRGEHMLKSLEFVLILTVAAIPVAMPAVLSVTMAVGARFLAKKQAIVTKLASIEELAGVNILCSDKTGTLTQNKLKLGEPFSLLDIEPKDLILNAALASREEDNDEIDLTVLSGVADADREKLKAYKVIHFLAFDPVNKRTEATLEDKNGHIFSVTKGAPQVILSLVDNADIIRQDIEKKINEFASRGFRSLAVARKNDKDTWKILGIIPLYDPPREDSKETIKKAKEMGLNVKMLTGDQAAIAKEIARELDLGTNILDAASLIDAAPHTNAELTEAIAKADGFAQVFPEHKYKIVDLLQEEGNIVGMTGDGVNDAPALKKADVGIAVSGAQDAARTAAAIVLLLPGLSVIIDSIKASREIFQRMKNYAIYRIAETIRVLLFMTLAILVFNFYPLTAVMIVLLAVLNDGAILSIAYDRVKLSTKPVLWNMREVLTIATALGITGVISTFGLFYVAERLLNISRDSIQSFMYLKLSVAGHLTIFVTRTRGPFWSYRPSLILLLAVLGTQTLATLIAVYGVFMPPIGWEKAILIWAYALVWFLIDDRVKLMAYHKKEVN